MTQTSSKAELVALKGGLAVPVDALQLLWRLEHQGLTVERSQRGTLLVGPREALTDSDREAIAQHRDPLLTLVQYVEQLDAEDPA